MRAVRGTNRWFARSRVRDDEKTARTSGASEVGMAIHIRGLEVRFRDTRGADVPVLDVKELNLEDGRRLCLVGGSGSGKTTLLHVLAGIVTPTKGEVRYGDVDLTKLPEAERDRFRAKNVGYIFQSFNLLQGLSALENVAIAGTFGGQGAHEAKDRANKLLDRVGLSHRKDARPGTMSVGEQQRVGIARALVNRPKVVLADEPTASLDDERADEVLALLEEVVKEEKATLVLVTHEQRVRERFTDVLDLKELGR